MVAPHTSTLSSVNNLGNLYKTKGKIEEWALRGEEKALGAEHMSTPYTINNFGILYSNQGKMAEAEEMYVWALRGYKKAME